MKKNRVLVTGRAGYIGSMLCTFLVEKGYFVTAVDLLKYDKSSLNHLFFYKNFKFINGDIRKKRLMKNLVKRNDFIVPLAALVGAPLCEKFKKDAVNTNLRSVKMLCDLTTKKKQDNLSYNKFRLWYWRKKQIL